MRKRLGAASTALTLLMLAGIAALPLLPRANWLVAIADDPGDEEGGLAEAPEGAPPPVGVPAARHGAGPSTASVEQAKPSRSEDAGSSIPALSTVAPPPPAVVSTGPAVVASIETEPTAPGVAAEPPVQLALPPAVGEAGPHVEVKPRTVAQAFGALKEPSQAATRSIGAYAKGCLAGGQALPVTGPTWQVMRTSRNRNWGHPSLIRFIERLATEAHRDDGWPGLLIGDMSQPRGGPMTFGHASHQTGLDVDIWYKPMPDHEQSRKERDETKMTSVLVNPGHVDPDLWTTRHIELIRLAASDPEVARVFVHPAIKKDLCETIAGDRAFLRKVRPFWGHDDHFHVRLSCPPDSADCQRQAAVANDEGCGKELESWLRRVTPAAPAPEPAPSVQVAGMAAGTAPAAAAGSGTAPTVQPAAQNRPEPQVRPLPRSAAGAAPKTAPVAVAAPISGGNGDGKAAVVVASLPAATFVVKGLDKWPAQCKGVLAAPAVMSASAAASH